MLQLPLWTLVCSYWLLSVLGDLVIYSEGETTSQEYALVNRKNLNSPTDLEGGKEYL